MSPWASRIPVVWSKLRTFEIEGRPNPPDGGEAVQFLSVGSGLLPSGGGHPRYLAATSTMEIAWRHYRSQS